MTAYMLEADLQLIRRSASRGRFAPSQHRPSSSIPFTKLDSSLFGKSWSHSQQDKQMKCQSTKCLESIAISSQPRAFLLAVLRDSAPTRRCRPQPSSSTSQHKDFAGDTPPMDLNHPMTRSIVNIVASARLKIAFISNPRFP